jgi:dihydrofolate synthase/folylpolyglutamate synthase
LAFALREEFAFRRLVAVVGMMRDKDARGVLAELEPVVDEVMVTRVDSPRAMDVDDLAAAAREVFDDSRVVIRDRLPDAIGAAISSADVDSDRVSGTGVVVTGSVAMVGQARTLFDRDPQ